jgi:small-conductance mechanosensitive channel
LEAVWWALKDKGITIAYTQMDLHLDKDVVDAMAKNNP